jgi:hypothetical protein
MRGGRAVFLGVLLLAYPGGAHAGPPLLLLPSGIPTAQRGELQQIADTASVRTHVRAEPFVARGDVFEYLLDHPEFATHVTRTLKLARYRIWHTPEGLFLDDGWGATGRFSVIHAVNGTRVMLAQGQYRQQILPVINGQAVVVLEYDLLPTRDGRASIRTAVTGFVKLDNRLLDLASRLAGAVVSAKAEKEAQRLVRVFARASRAVEERPAEVFAQLRERPDVPRRELEEFRQLLNVR